MMRRLILGTAGHIDHGKTTLIRALTGVDTDRLPEEKRRGITIDLGFAHMALASGDELAIIDVPGHEAFVKNMLAGATGIDVALVVVAADESVMPQTREHLDILDLLGVRAGVIAVTKADLVDEDWLELVIAEVRETLAAGPLADAPIVPVSATTARGLEALTAALEHAGGQVNGRDVDDLFRLPIDRVFTVRGTGTVVTGTVWSGALARDATLHVLPGGGVVRVRALQAFGQERERVVAGERAAIALAGFPRDQLARGDLLATGEGWQVAPMLTARVRVLESSPRPLRHRQRVWFHLGTLAALGRAVILDGEHVEPGDAGWVQLRLETPVVARAGDRFVLRSYSPVTTFAGGTVVEPIAPKRSRLGAIDRANLEHRLNGAAVDAIVATVRGSAEQGIPASRLAILTGYPPRTLDAAVASDPALLDLNGWIVHGDTVDRCKSQILEIIDRHHRAEPMSLGAALESIRRAMPPATPPAVFDRAHRSLVEQCEIAAEGVTVRRATFSPRLTPDQGEVAQRLIETVRAGGLSPPTRDELPADLTRRPDFDRITRFLENRGDLVPISTGLWMDPAVVEAAIARSRERLPAATPLAPTVFKELFSISRKYLIPLLEYFDRAGVTARVGDNRVLGHRR
ncbi:MAG: selenocysteine-specific translation elongation factor [Longimicrobiales bacterium]